MIGMGTRLVLAIMSGEFDIDKLAKNPAMDAMEKEAEEHPAVKAFVRSGLYFQIMQIRRGRG
jgi:hypothetical protein